MWTVGIDIGGTSLRIGLVDAQGCAHHVERVPQRQVLTEAGESATLARLADFVKDHLRRCVPGEAVAAMCVGVPATIDAARQTVLSAPNVPALSGLNIPGGLGALLPFPVYLEKDVNVLLAYDMHRFALDPAQTIVACYVGTGLGNAIMMNGRLLRGDHGVAGELGHIPVKDFDGLCGCGNRGCMEMLAGGRWLAHLRETHWPGTPIEQLFVAHAQEPLLAEYLDIVGQAIAIEVNILDPTTVIVGGGVPSMPGFPTDALSQRIRVHTRKPLPEAALQLRFSQDDGGNGATGAGLIAWAHHRKGDWA